MSGSVFEFTSVDAGQSWVKDADGNVIAAGRGSVRETIRFDTLGDDEPGGELIMSVSVRANGQHTDFDPCSIFGE